MNNNRFRSWDQYMGDAHKARRPMQPRKRNINNPVIKIDLVAILKARLPKEGGDK
jgi:hypothetical protein